MDLHDRWLKSREIRHGCAFWGFRQKIFTPTPNIPQIPKILHYESRFSRKTRINLGGSSAKIRTRIGNSPWGFQIWGYNLTRSRILAVSRMRSRKLAKST